MEGTNLQNDPVMDKIKVITEQDREIVDEAVGTILEHLKSKLDKQENFTLKHGYLTCAKAMIYLSQALCDSEEEFEAELNAAQVVAIDRVMPSILPKIEDGKIVEEGYDLENLSVRRLMMTMGTTVDYIFWRNEISKYSETRAEIESEEKETEPGNITE